MTPTAHDTRNIIDLLNASLGFTEDTDEGAACVGDQRDEGLHFGDDQLSENIAVSEPVTVNFNPDLLF